MCERRAGMGQRTLLFDHESGAYCQRAELINGIEPLVAVPDARPRSLAAEWRLTVRSNTKLIGSHAAG